MFLPLLSLLLASPAHAGSDTPPPPPPTGLGSSPTAALKAAKDQAQARVTPIPTVTEVPPWLRGDVALNYGYDRLGGHLTEHVLESSSDTASLDQQVGQRVVSDHVLSIDAMFSAGPGVGVTLGFPVHIREGTWFGNSQTMVYDPTSGAGTMIGTTSVDYGSTSAGGGLEGVWIGLAGTPFSEAFHNRNNRVTWRVAGALRTANKKNFYTAGTDGKRGAGDGALGLKLENAFSTTIGGGTQPYISWKYQSDGQDTVDVTDDSGNVLASGVQLQGAKTSDIRFGAEFLAAHNDDQDTNVRVDLHATIDYASTSLVPSGLYLPSILDVTAGQPMQEAESVDLGGGIGFSFQPVQYFRIGIFGQVCYHLPQRIESFYPIYTSGDTIHSVVGGNMVVRIR